MTLGSGDGDRDAPPIRSVAARSKPAEVSTRVEPRVPFRRVRRA